MAPPFAIDLQREMSSPPLWVPGNFLSRGEDTIVDITGAVSDPTTQVRLHRGQGIPSDLLYKPLPEEEWFQMKSRDTILLLVSCSILASTVLSLVAYYYL